MAGLEGSCFRWAYGIYHDLTDDHFSTAQGFKKGADVPEPSPLKELLKDPARAEEFAARGRDIVQEGMKKDAEK